MIINPANARMWSKLGPRGTLGLAITEIVENDPKAIVLTADLAITSGLGRLLANHPEKVINVGIAEQNMLGVAAGFAKEGFNVFCTTFATFASMRSFEMVKLHMGYGKFNIKLVGLSAGFAMGMFGNTHYATEDIALLRTVPNLTILSPADCVETVKCVEVAHKHQGPVYIRLTGVSGCPVVFKDDYELQVGKINSLRHGKDLSILATGSMTHYALEAAKLLQENGIDATVANVPTLKPISTSYLDVFIGCGPIVTIEEHSVIGGLGSLVAERRSCLSRVTSNPHLIIGVVDEFKKAGSYKHMLAQNGLVTDSIADRIAKWMTRANGYCND